MSKFYVPILSGLLGLAMAAFTYGTGSLWTLIVATISGIVCLVGLMVALSQARKEHQKKENEATVRAALESQQRSFVEESLKITCAGCGDRIDKSVATHVGSRNAVFGPEDLYYCKKCCGGAKSAAVTM